MFTDRKSGSDVNESLQAISTGLFGEVTQLILTGQLRPDVLVAKAIGYRQVVG